jgi:hypothetical protein
MKTKRYIGMKKPLRGKLALVREGEKPGTVLAQFNDMSLTYRNRTMGYGWHEFKVEEFSEVEA